MDLIPLVLDVWMFQLLQLFLQGAVSLFFGVFFFVASGFGFPKACCRVLGFIAENHSETGLKTTLIISSFQTFE